MDRSDIYRSVERAIDQITGNHLQTIIASLRDIRRQDVGDNVAEQEEQAGNKTDEEFEAHVKAMREEREQIYREELRKKKEAEEEAALVVAEEERRKREEKAASEREAEEKCRAEIERGREEAKEREEQREREQRARLEEWERRRRDQSPRYRDDARRDKKSPTPRKEWNLTPSTNDEETLEEAALQRLLSEGEGLKARPRPGFGRAETRQNGHRQAPNGSGYPTDDAEARRGSKEYEWSGRSRGSRRDDEEKWSSSWSIRFRDRDKTDSTSGLSVRDFRDSPRDRDHRPHSRRSRSRSTVTDKERRRSRERDHFYPPRDRVRDKIDSANGLSVRDFRDSRWDRSYRPHSRRSRSRSTVIDKERRPRPYRDSHRSRSPPRRTYYPMDDYYDRYQPPLRDYSPRMRYHERSPIPYHRDSARERGRDFHSGRHRPYNRSPSRSRRDGDREESRRPRSRSRQLPPPRKQQPSPSMLQIDRYVPSTSNRSRSPRRRVHDERPPLVGGSDRYVPGNW